MAYDLISGEQTAANYARGEGVGSSMMGAEGEQKGIVKKLPVLARLLGMWGGSTMVLVGFALSEGRAKPMAMPLMVGGGAAVASALGSTLLNKTGKSAPAKLLAATAAAGVGLGALGAFRRRH